ncbi:MAG: TIGR02281 family clan AA aspartic protease [Bauldia sp.]
MIQRVAIAAGFSTLLVVLAGRTALPVLIGERPAEPAAAPAERAAVAAPARGVVLRKAANGHFAATASADGRSVDFLVDTGATTVVLTAETALRLGFKPKPADFTARMETANGSVGAVPVTLKEVRVGQISLANVSAAIAPQGALNVNLLGMSFLSRLRKFEFAGDQLILTP